MKRTLAVIVNIVGAVLLACGQTGAWSGDIEVQGTRLPVVFHLDDDRPCMDSPAQGARGIPIQIDRSAPDSIKVNIPAIGGSYVARYNGEELVGTFAQRGVRLPLILSPGERTANRPQTPLPPYPYAQEEVAFTNGNATLRGTLTLPEGYSRKAPVVIMVTGSGLQNRDEEIFDHRPFAVIADALAREGIASLRYDDRGFGESTGDAVNCTTEDLMHDALASVKLLRERFDRVGVLGHSEGGTIALMLAADGEADFIVSLAGMVVSGKETLLDQNRYALSRAGYSQEVTDEYCSLVGAAFDGDKFVLVRLIASTLPNELKQNLQAALKQLNTPYMQYTLTLDMRGRLGDIHCPVLALNGTKDTQVSCEKNLAALRNGLPASAANKIESLDGLNHLFQRCTTGSVNEYALIEETISPTALTLITDWIKNR
ncbi:MAG: alpha/beta fold hydrolase [Muribaculaceae bacterium]|nr:alpha/beta fold hydrolase [Muribaculaceae bacterium]